MAARACPDDTPNQMHTTAGAGNGDGVGDGRLLVQHNGIIPMGPSQFECIDLEMSDDTEQCTDPNFSPNTFGHEFSTLPTYKDGDDALHAHDDEILIHEDSEKDSEDGRPTKAVDVRSLPPNPLVTAHDDNDSNIPP